MNKKTALIIAAIVVVLAGAGVVTAVVLNQGKKDSNTSNSSNSTENKKSTTDPSKTFSPTDPTTLSYVATSTTTVSGQTMTSTIESDGKGVQKSASSVAGMTTESYIKGNDVTTCVNGSCSKTTVDPSTASSDQIASSMAQYKDSATHTGAETIDGKSYQVWKANGPAGEVTYYIDGENRVGRIVMANVTVSYDYKPVTITIPQV